MAERVEGGPAELPRALRQDWPVPWQPVWGDKRGPWRTFLFIVWLLLLHTLRFDTQRYAERWRGPANRPPGSPWPHRHPHEACGTAREGDC